ncbi:Rhomboid 1, mitochondrial [Lecanosticta acicola]|uniref:Rhomboid 1, mitochondrial n=1 Tax=Lecanosticta acicola TaxID=111012 RepID=A0AAI9EEY9_9PEZI|nr:Rhomboid 1, mitochondrial [Lecanosticta acicola]
MSNVWSAIAFAAPCAVRRSRSKPLVQLFNGYARYASQSVPNGRARRSWFYSQNSPTIARPGNSASIRASFLGQRDRLLSTTLCLQAQSREKQRGKRTSQPANLKEEEAPTSPSGVQSAPTVASHTEGLPSTAEEPLTWRDYDPVAGMPLPQGELCQSQIDAIFNSEHIDADMGNYILSVMHWRRQSGALIDVGLEFPQEMGVDRDMALKGLNYVRSVVPDVDENQNGQRWAEEEIQRSQEEIHARAVQLGFYKATPEEQDQYAAEEEDQGTSYGREKTGTSILRQTREANEAAWELEEAAREVQKQKDADNAIHAARGPLELAGRVQPLINTEMTQNAEIRGPFGITIKRPVNHATLTQPSGKSPWIDYYEEQAQIIKDNVVPQLSIYRRLVPPFFMLLLVLGGCYYLSENYTPPPQSARLWPETPPSVATMLALTGILCATFILGRWPPLYRFSSKYMTVVPAYPYAVSLVGALFRHDTFQHLGWNLVSLWLFGLLLHEEVGRGNFLAIYLASGVFGSYSALLYNVIRKQWTTYIIGSSGCILGILAAACTLKPNSTIKVFGYEIPIAAWVFLAMFGAGEAFAALRGFKTTARHASQLANIDHAGHLGGIIMGVTAGLHLRQVAKRGQMTEIKNPEDVAKRTKEEVRTATAA